MFVSKNLVFVELHKTGGTHIGLCLQKLIGGDQIGKHNRVPAELRNRFILGSVRNPWDWYVSLWAYGCAGEGSVRRQTTRGIDLDYLWRQLNKEMGQQYLDPMSMMRQLWHDARRPYDLWRATYTHPKDVVAFRAWVRLVMNPGQRFDIGEGFGFSPVSSNFGLMTYRYLKFFTSLDAELYTNKSLANLAGVRNAYQKKTLVSFVIRNEKLEQDLLLGLQLAGYHVSSSDRDAIIQSRDARTNSSNHLPSKEYYDPETSELVATKEVFVIEQHHYRPPWL